LTHSERYFIVHGIPEGSMCREISLIWEIPAKMFRRHSVPAQHDIPGIWLDALISGAMNSLAVRRVSCDQTG
jgi:hypothetical protein